MTRGFITIATGKKHYYYLAANLLKSYRLFSKSPLPFAIIAEEENEYTEMFDDVILTDEATRSFMDKFLLMKLCPYDETIFIDADSLVYGDLNKFWQEFDGATDFSASGVNVPLDQKENCWYNVEDIGEYGKKIEYKVRVHAGVCFIRRSETLTKLYDDCMDIIENYDSIHFHSFGGCKDECTLGVSMPMNNMKAVRLSPEIFAFYPCLTYLKTDMLQGRFAFKTYWGSSGDEGILLHFGTDQTFDAVYRFDSECVDYLLKYNEKIPLIQKIKYKYKLRKYFLDVQCFVKRSFGALKRKFKKLIRILFNKKNG